MDPRLLLVAVLLFPAVSAGPGVVVLVHHPNDGIDPLGFAYGASDPFMARHGHFDRFQNGVDYPGLVVDGRVPYDGLAEGEDPLAATLSVYNGAVTMRHGVETPVTLTVATGVFDGVVRANVTTDSPDLGDGLRLWSALVEDPVHYEPPTGLTNGVFEHPFTTRSIQNHGPVALDGTQSWDLNLTIGDWAPEQLLLAVWIQQDASDGRFKPHEVVQATMHPVTASEPTVQDTRGVLVEAYSATWCDPCLIGDRALELLAQEHGLQPQRLPETATGYYQAPAYWVWLAAVAGFALLAFGRMRGPG